MEAVINILIMEKDSGAKFLEEFIETASQVFLFPTLNTNNRRKLLWEAILSIAATEGDETVLKNCFIAIRILSRDKTGLNELVTNEWFDLILTHSGLNSPNYEFDTMKLPMAVEALKSLCNVIFNSNVAAKMCCQNGILQKLSLRLKTHLQKQTNDEIRFFDVKLIFLLTALCPEVRNKVREEMDGLSSMLKLMEQVLKEAATMQASPIHICLKDKHVDLVCELLKALFNITLNSFGDNDDDEENKRCEHLVQLMRTYILLPTESPEQERLLKSNIINLLTNILPSYYKHLMLPVQTDQNVSHTFQYDGQNMSAFYEILKFLERQFCAESGVSKQYEALSPVVTVLLRAAAGERRIRKYLRLQILPPLRDVRTRPEQGNTLRNHFCRLLTSPITQLRDLVADLLFILCKKSVKRMIKYTGYGNAAGLFAKRGLLGGKTDSEAADFSSESEDSETEEYAELKHGINPVLGCYEEPHPSAMESMTDEQKEYEAMKLVELIDSLTKCGAIRPCRVGADGKPHPIDHVLQLQEGLKNQQLNDSDNE